MCHKPRKVFRKLTSRPHHYLCASYQLSGKCWSHISSDNAVLCLFLIILHCRAKVIRFRDFLQHRISEWNGHKEFLRKLWLASGTKTTVFSLFKVNLMHHSQQTYYKAFSINCESCVVQEYASLLHPSICHFYHYWRCNR